MAPDTLAAQGEQPQSQDELWRYCNVVYFIFCFICYGCPTKGLFYTAFVEYAQQACHNCVLQHCLSVLINVFRFVVITKMYECMLQCSCTMHALCVKVTTV